MEHGTTLRANYHIWLKCEQSSGDNVGNDIKIVPIDHRNGAIGVQRRYVPKTNHTI